MSGNLKAYAFLLLAVSTCVAASDSRGLVDDSPKYHPCVKKCPITTDYTPFCGSDGLNYPTKSYLPCFKKCNLTITKAHDGLCTPLDNPCVKKCPKTLNIAPVCGSDNQTYDNLSFIRCFEKCNINITKAYDGPCRKAPLPQATDINSKSSNDYEHYDPCVKKCLTTEDYTPFCGSDGLNYPTKSYLPCFKKCNLTITKAHDGLCTPLDNPCVKKCPKTLNIAPVCGSDNHTYINLSFIGCFGKCNINITKAYDGPCKQTTPALPKL